MTKKCDEVKKKVLFVATVKGHIKAFHIPYLKLFKEHGYETYVATKENKEVTIEYCDHFISIPFERSPFHVNNIKSYRVLKKYFEKENFDIIHCHTPVAAAITRLAAKKSRKQGTKVFYTVHGFHFFDGAPIQNWIIYYPVEKWLAQYTDVLITINKEDYQRAKKKFHAGKVEYIPGVGVDLEKFRVEDDFNRTGYRTELGLKSDDIMLLSVGELNKNKNHQIVIRAMAQIKNPKLQYFIAGEGTMKSHLIELAQKLNLSDQVHLLGFRKDISELLASSDVFVFPSYREGLSLALMEAMVSGTMIICSDIRGNRDLIEDGYNGFLFKPDDFKRLVNTIKIITDINRFGRLQYIKNNERKITEFSLYTLKEKYKNVYFRR